MPISGLMITLDEDPRRTEGALGALRACPAVTLGEPNGRWLPLALEAPNDAASRAWHEWIQSLPGVAFVDVVCVHFDDEPTTASPSPESSAAPVPASPSHSHEF